jgi:hypothetical protein
MFNMTFEQLVNFDWLQLRVGPVVLLAFLSVTLLTAIVMAWRGNNRLAALDNRCATANADVDAQMKHRHNSSPASSRRCGAISAMSTRC